MTELKTGSTRNEDRRFRRLAKRENLIATRRNGLWYFSDERNYLQSPEQDLDDVEALEYLRQ